MSPQPPPGPGGSLGFPVALQPGVTSGKGSSLKFNLVLPGGAWGYHPGAVPTLGQGNEACPDQTASSLFGKEQESGAGAAGPPRSHNPEIAGANHPALWRLGFFSLFVSEMSPNSSFWSPRDSPPALGKVTAGWFCLAEDLLPLAGILHGADAAEHHD